MKLSKKICSLLMALILMLSVMPAFAEEGTEIKTDAPSERYSEDVKLLTALGLYSFGEYAYNDTVSRGEFAKMIADLLGATETADGGKFTDVTAETPNKDAIYAVSSMGLMNGMGDGTFRPDDSVTYIQAIKVLVSALGYKPMADAEGGYYAGYFNCALDLKLYVTKGADHNAPLTFENAAELLVKTAETPVFELVAVSENTSVFESNEDKTLLNVYHNIYKEEGRMTDNGITALNGKSAISDEAVRIGSNTFVKAFDGAKEYLGYNLEYYFKDESGVKSLLYAEADDRKNDVVTVNARDLLADDAGFKKTCLVTEINGKKKEYDIYQYAYLIYNGAYDATFTSASLKIRQGEITLIDSDGDKKYETVMVEEYKDIVANNVQTANEKIIAKRSADSAYMAINYGEYDYVVFENANGEIIDPATVKADNVISVFLSKGKEKARFRVSTATDEITINLIDTEDGAVIAENDKAYLLSKAYEDMAASGNMLYPKAELGESYKLYLNYENIVAAADKIDGKVQYAYFMGFTNGTGLNKSDVYLKLFLETNDCVYAKAAKNITINTVKKQSPDRLLDEAEKLVDSEGNAKPQLVRMVLNKKGELTEIETAQNDVAYLNKNLSAATTAPTPYSFDLKRFTLNYQDMQTTNTTAPSSSGIANYKVITSGFAVDRNTKIFMIRDYSDSFTTTDEENIEVIDFDTYGKLYGKGHSKLFDADETWVCGAALLSLPTALGNRFFTVAESPRFVHRDDMNIMQVSGYFKNNYWNFYEAHEDIFAKAVRDAGFSDGIVKKGDVFNIAFDTDNISILNARLVYSPLRHDKGSFYTPVWYASINGSMDEFWMLGTVMSYNNGAFGVYAEKKLAHALDDYWMKPLSEDSSYSYSPIFLPNYISTQPTVLQFDCATGELTRVTEKDIPVQATINAEGNGFDITDTNTMVFINRARAVVSDVMIITNLDAVK